MRISSQANELYRKTSLLADQATQSTSSQPQAKTTTTSFGFRLGKFKQIPDLPGCRPGLNPAPDYA